MAWHKKAQSEDVFWFAFFYMPMTAIVVLSLVLMPRHLMGTALQPVPLDEAIQARQLNSMLWKTNELTGRTNTFEYEHNSKINQIQTKKQMTYRVQLGTDEKYYRQDLFKIAKPIAPYRYEPFNQVRHVRVNDKIEQLHIEMYYPKQYETVKK